ncbi:MAG: antitoxin [Spirochaetota bacterium]|jgi:predicted DNA binding CopG/RHH family protein|uniref:antitoxin n=1 Tax=Rectinema subterraneum TaxID=2653714 RepID=UPI00131A91A3|nr:antitoxin [Rectinema subterraneum]
MTIDEDRELIQSVENGEWQPVKDFDSVREELVKAAKETALKDYRMNIRISKRDVELLKAKALEEGLPYQTFVTSILHKFITGKLKEGV